MSQVLSSRLPASWAFRASPRPVPQVPRRTLHSSIHNRMHRAPSASLNGGSTEPSDADSPEPTPAEQLEQASLKWQRRTKSGNYAGITPAMTRIRDSLMAATKANTLPSPQKLSMLPPICLGWAVKMLASEGDVEAARQLLYHALDCGVGHPGLLRSFISGCSNASALQFLFDTWREVLRRWPSMLQRGYIGNDLICAFIDARDLTLANAVLYEMRDAGEAILPALGTMRLMEAWTQIGQPKKAIELFHLYRQVYHNGQGSPHFLGHGRRAIDEALLNDEESNNEEEDQQSLSGFDSVGGARCQPITMGIYWKALDALVAMSQRFELAMLTRWAGDDGLVPEHEFHVKLVNAVARVNGIRIARTELQKRAEEGQPRMHVLVDSALRGYAERASPRSLLEAAEQLATDFPTARIASSTVINLLRCGRRVGAGMYVVREALKLRRASGVRFTGLVTFELLNCMKWGWRPPRLVMVRPKASGRKHKTKGGVALARETDCEGKSAQCQLDEQVARQEGMNDESIRLEGSSPEDDVTTTATTPDSKTLPSAHESNKDQEYVSALDWTYTSTVARPVCEGARQRWVKRLADAVMARYIKALESGEEPQDARVFNALLDVYRAVRAPEATLCVVEAMSRNGAWPDPTPVTYWNAAGAAWNLGLEEEAKRFEELEHQALAARAGVRRHQVRLRGPTNMPKPLALYGRQVSRSERRRLSNKQEKQPPNGHGNGVSNGTTGENGATAAVRENETKPVQNVNTVP